MPLSEHSSAQDSEQHEVSSVQQASAFSVLQAVNNSAPESIDNAINFFMVLMF